MFYVYIHRKLTDGEIFYVGKGQGDRAWSTEGRTRQWIKIAAECGRRVEILSRFDNEDDALHVEATMIELHRARIVNIQSGHGARARHWVHAPEGTTEAGVEVWAWRNPGISGCYKFHASIDEMVERGCAIRKELTKLLMDKIIETRHGWRIKPFQFTY